MKSSEFETGTGKTLKHEDIGNDEWELTIKGITKHLFDQTNRETQEQYKEWKPIFSFEEIEKTFVCNKSNRRILTAAYGDDMDEWVGKTIFLYTGMWPSGDKGIHARAPKKAIKPTKSENPADGMPSDEIPF
jgi:hypothetical protein